MYLRQLVAPLFVAVILIGCGGGDEAVSVDKAARVTVGSSQYVIAKDVKVESSKIDGMNAAAFSSGLNQEIGSVVAEMSEGAQASSSAREASALMIDSYDLQSAVRSLYGTDHITYISTLTEQVVSDPVNYAMGDYIITTDTEMKALGLVGSILDTISGGTTSGFPEAAASAMTSQAFRMLLTIVEYESNEYYIVVVVPVEAYDDYAAQANIMSNGKNMTDVSVSLVDQTEAFEGSSGGLQADFLFVIDSSSSMSDDQDAVAQAANDFGDVIEDSGLDHQIAIISTGYGIASITAEPNNVLNTVGIIDNDIALFKQQVVLGTRGSNIETGIYNAEQSLLSVADGDVTDGILTSIGFPRKDASLSIVIISDEPSQYIYRAGEEFNTTKNLFLDRDYTVHVIVEELEASRGQYDDLAIATGGLVGNIKNSDINGNLDFRDIMENIAIQASGATSRFELADRGVIPSTIEVTVNDVKVANSNSDGWSYVESTNTVRFSTTAIPKEGDKVLITYEYKG